MSPLPHIFITMISSLLILGAILIRAAKAWAGSNAGIMPSVLQQYWKASKASSSVADTYLTLFCSNKKECSGPIPG